LDILVSTDHDTVSDFAPVARALGLDDRVRMVAGIEMSMLYGHINGFPLVAAAPEAYFHPGWIRYDAAGKFDRVSEPDEVVAELRARGAGVVQINHPRDSTGVFNYIDLDPDSGAMSKPWPAPDACEVLNGKRLDDWTMVFRDVNTLRRTGRTITMTGASDCHNELGLGYARTMIRSASDDPATLDLDAVWRAVREGRAIAMNGPFVAFTATQAGGEAARVFEIGDTVEAAPGEVVTFSVRVEAPSWMDAGRLVLFERGVEKYSRELTEADRDAENPAIRIAHTFTSSAAESADYVVMVEGHPGVENPAPLKNGSRTITNPIFVTRR
jgi:hypothetical protein